MITDEERRVVASSLRESANVGGARTLKRELARALGIRLDACTSEGSHTNILRGLADLIDRPTCSMRDLGDKFEQVYRCSACGEEYCMSDIKPYPWRFCPMCAAMVTEKEEDDDQ